MHAQFSKATLPDFLNLNRSNHHRTFTTGPLSDLRHVLASRRYRRAPAARRGGRGADAAGRLGAGGAFVGAAPRQQGVDAEGGLALLQLRVHVEGLRLVGGRLVVRVLGDVVDVVGHSDWKRTRRFSVGGFESFGFCWFCCKGTNTSETNHCSSLISGDLKE